MDSRELKDVTYSAILYLQMAMFDLIKQCRESGEGASQEIFGNAYKKDIYILREWLASLKQNEIKMQFLRLKEKNKKYQIKLEPPEPSIDEDLQQEKYSGQ